MQSVYTMDAFYDLSEDAELATLAGQAENMYQRKM